MKILTLLLPSLFCLPASAADSLAIFHQAGKVTIVVNETGPGKLAELFRAFVTDPARESFEWSTRGDASSDVILSCRRGFTVSPPHDPYSCTFKFAPSANVKIGAGTMNAALGDLGSSVLVDLSFENSAKETFRFKFLARGMLASSSKTGL